MKAWPIINELIQECIVSTNPIECLTQLFEKTGDGMVALRLGDQFEDMGNHEDAAKYYREAYRRFPYVEWKHTAKQKLDAVEVIKPDNRKNESTLFVISCTAKKIWKYDQTAPEFIPAKFAYIGNRITGWLKDIKSSNSKWIILSAKYGFIEPYHPISNYDVTFDDKKTGPISDESLKNQVMYQERQEFKLRRFEKVIVKGSEIYYEKVKMAFSETGARVERGQP